MSRHLYAKNLWLINVPGVVPDHSGFDYQNPDIRQGDILAEDVDGEWYLMRSKSNLFYHDQDSAKIKSCWPSKRAGKIQLYRDAWKIMPADFQKSRAPYFASIRESQKTLIK